MSDVLSQREVDELLSSVERKLAGGAGTSGGIRYYDFLRPERASLSELRTLEEVHEISSRSLAVALSGALKLPVSVRLQAFEQIAWGEFLLMLPNPTCLAVVEAPSALGSFAVEIGPAVLYPAIERLLGSDVPSFRSLPPARPLTQIERRVALAVVGMVLDALGEAWGFSGKAAGKPLRAVQIETNPQTVMLAPPADMAALARFEVSFGEPGEPTQESSEPAPGRGLVHVCIPFGPCRELLRELVRLREGTSRKAQEPTDTLAEALLGVPIKLEAILIRRRIPLREVLALSEGDVLKTDVCAGGEVSLEIAGRRRLRATLGEYKGRQAVRVLEGLGRSYG